MWVDGYPVQVVPETLGIYEFDPETLRVVEVMLDLLCSTGPRVLVDAGAGVGTFSLLTTAVDGLTCHAFEPHPSMLEVLRAAIADRPRSISFCPSRGESARIETGRSASAAGIFGRPRASGPD